MNLITGRAGVAHITPRQDAMWHQGLTETESCIFDAYENFAAEIITNNEVRIRSGVGMLQGRFFCIEPNTYDSADIANGNQGEYRKDLIVARITVDASTNTQSASIEVIQGTPAAENPTAPEATVGDLDAGDLIADYPLVEVLLNGINIESLTPVFDTGWLFNGAGRQKLNFIGVNPIASTEEDTPANWAALGTGHAYIKSNVLNNQPIQYCFVENKVYVGSDGGGLLITQTLHALGRGTSAETYTRAGNVNGWYAGSANWVKQLNENNGIQMKKLWENASPTSNFAAQTITVETMREGDFVAIESKTQHNSNESNIQMFKIKAGLSSQIIHEAIASDGGDPYFTRRSFDISQLNKIIFGNGYYRYVNSKNVADNNYAIPVEIYLVKGVS